MNENPGQVVLVRHGETEWSANGRHTSRTDLPLTPAGEEQARAVGRALESQRFGLVLSSPRRRAQDTAALAGYPGAETDGDLVEWDYGAYEGLTTAQISADVGHPWSLWEHGVLPTPEGAGEQADDLLQRNRRIIDRILPTLENGDDVLLFSHGHYLRTLAATWIGSPVALGQFLVLGTAAVSVLGFEHDQQVLCQWNRSAWREMPSR